MSTVTEEQVLFLPTSEFHALGHSQGFSSEGRLRRDRGRDGCFQPPPAQIRTRSTTSYGSCC